MAKVAQGLDTSITIVPEGFPRSSTHLGKPGTTYPAVLLAGETMGKAKEGDATFARAPFERVDPQGRHSYGAL